MKIEVLYVPGCPGSLLARERTLEALAGERLKAEIREIVIQDRAMAESLGFSTSPTIRINGCDVGPEAETEPAAGLCCRFRPSEPTSLPITVEQIRRAIRHAAAGEVS